MYSLQQLLLHNILGASPDVPYAQPQVAPSPQTGLSPLQMQNLLANPALLAKGRSQLTTNIQPETQAPALEQALYNSLFGTAPGPSPLTS